MRLQAMFRTTIVCVLLGLCTGPAFAEWPQFRGQNSSGLAKGSPPVVLGPVRVSATLIFSSCKTSKATGKSYARHESAVITAVS